MTTSYKVGENTQFGTLLAEAVKGDNPEQINSLYANLDNSGYIIIEWAKSDEQGEYETNRTKYDNLYEARRNWLKLTFSVEV